MINRATGKNNSAVSRVYWIIDMLSQVDPLFHFPFSFLFASRCSICHTLFFHAIPFLCLKPRDLCHCLHPQKAAAFVVRSLLASIHLSITSTLGLSPPLISLPIAVACVCRPCQNCYRCCHFPRREQSRPLLMAPQKTQEKRAQAKKKRLQKEEIKRTGIN